MYLDSTHPASSDSGILSLSNFMLPPPPSPSSSFSAYWVQLLYSMYSCTWSHLVEHGQLTRSNGIKPHSPFPTSISCERFLSSRWGL